MALLDRDSVSGAVRFHKEAKQTHPGIDGRRGDCRGRLPYPLLVETREGYQNLCRLLTKIKLREASGNQHKAAATRKKSRNSPRG